MDNIVILIPSLDPNEKLVRTVKGMISVGFSNILLVNDGSEKENIWPFEELSVLPEVKVIGYEENHGKGYALKYGFQYVIDNYPNAAGVLTADGDGQHLPEDCLTVAKAMLERNENVLGCRNFKDPSVPKRNKTGNTISIFAYNFLCGIKLSDTQTGLRAIPTRYLSEYVNVEGTRFEYETNVLIYMKDKNIAFSEIPIKTVYEEDSNDGSHFRVFEDSVKIYKPLLKYGGPRLLKFMCGSLLSTVIDLGLFTLFTWLITKFFENSNNAEFLTIIASVFGAGFFARIGSSLFNYMYNKHAVFKDRPNARMTIVKYYAAALCVLAASTICVSIISLIFGSTGFARTVIKLIVDTCLFIASYTLQREWVFKE